MCSSSNSGYVGKTVQMDFEDLFSQRLSFNKLVSVLKAIKYLLQPYVSQTYHLYQKTDKYYF